jgi:hypothetical protein
LPQKYATIRCSFAAAHTPLTSVPAQSTRLPDCWQRRVCGGGDVGVGKGDGGGDGYPMLVLPSFIYLNITLGK